MKQFLLKMVHRITDEPTLMTTENDADLSVDPHFSRAPPLDRRDSLFTCEKLIFEKKLESPLILFIFFKGENKTRK